MTNPEILLICNNCNHVFEYDGITSYFTTCPKCNKTTTLHRYVTDPADIPNGGRKQR